MKRFLAIVLLAAACGGGKKSEPTTTTTTTATADVTASADVALELGDMKLVDVNKNKAVVIKADGSIEMEGKVIAIVTTDGKIKKADTGEVGFVLANDGTITGPDGKPVEVTLTSDAVIKSGDKSISLDATGTLLGGNPNAPQMKVEGATTTAQKRTALFVLIALTTPTSQGDTPSSP